MTDWRYKDTKLRGILHRNDDPDNEEVSVVNTVKELVPHLKTEPCYKGLNPLVIKHLEAAKTFFAINRVISMVYDYADDNKIWIEF
jgi:hypothetical protein